jgi:hypothetical protein
MPESDCCDCCGKFLRLENVTVCPACKTKEDEE